MGKCGKMTEVFSRVTGYHRPVKNWNAGKQEEFKERKPYHTGMALAKTPAVHETDQVAMAV